MATLSAPGRSSVPSAKEQWRILLVRNWQHDLRMKRVSLARVVLAPLLWGLYLLSFLFQSYDDTVEYVALESSANGTLFEIYGTEDAAFLASSVPDQWRVAVNSSAIQSSSVQALRDTLQQNVVNSVVQFVSSETIQNVSDYCASGFLDDTIPSESVCIDWKDETVFDIYYGGGKFTAPFDAALTQVQYMMQSILGAVPDMMQKVPAAVVIEEAARAPTPAPLQVLPGAMLVLASAVALQFTLSPLSADKFKDVVRSFQLVGVHMRTYMYSWIGYLALQAVVTAVILTIISKVWNLFALSSAGLIFLSHWLALVHTITMATVMVHYAQQQETVASVPWLTAMGSLVGGGLLVWQAGARSFLMFLLAVASPFGSMIQYCAIYLEYDVIGYDEGIALSRNFGSSGLAMAFVAQILGIALWNGGVFWASRPPKAKPLENVTPGPLDPNMFEDDSHQEGGGDVLLRVRKMGHEFEGTRGTCGKNAQGPNTVLRNLDLTIRRGEVFGYLGHNSSGKTTSIKILSGELALQAGEVEYNFQDYTGAATLVNDLPAIRRRIGICPQHNDALHGDVSCRDYLRLFAKLKGGVPIAGGQSLDEAIDEEVQRRIDDIAFTSPEDADKLIDTYSGGMKRKVCIALSFLCDPEVVFLDEPSAGIDPYNRRIVWDMIIKSKKGRSIILTTHFLDEADILSDRVGILKGGRLVACGSSLFLKHTVGGYKLAYDSTASPLDNSSFIKDAERVDEESHGSHSAWKLRHGCESDFPQALRALDKMGATNVALELTSLEQVFLETGKESFQKDNNGDENEGEEKDESEPEVTSDLLKKLWEPKVTKNQVTSMQKLWIVTKFMFSNAWKEKGSLFLNVIQPLIYLVVGFVVVGAIDSLTDVGTLITPTAIPVDPFLLLSTPYRNVRFFGSSNTTSSFALGPVQITLTPEPTSLDDYLGEPPILGGYIEETGTLQYNPAVSPFAKQISLQLFGSLVAVGSGNATESFATSLNQVPYISEDFRTDVLLLPMMLAFGFTGIIFSVLDLLVLKGYNVVALFRVTGISEFMVYMGVLLYKALLTFVPFFFISIILGNAIGSALFGNGGRWFATIITMLSFLYSTAPLGALIAKKFIKSDFKTAASIFPGIYLTVLSLPYIAWSVAYQLAEGARPVLTVVGDLMSLIPPVAFQRCIGSIIELSPRANDESVTWTKVWSWNSRILLPILEMLIVGSLEWWYLRRITVARPPKTTLKADETGMDLPSGSAGNFGVKKEAERSKADDDGINARELVKLFRVKPEKGAEQTKPYLKAAVKGVSFAVKKNSIMAVVGPNGAGKSTAMGILAAEHTAEYGSLALENQQLDDSNRTTNHLFDDGAVAFCPQFDALFPKKTVREHIAFYASVRGIDIREESAKEHIDAIVGLLGLEPHLDKLSTDISGGYKRRTCLAIAMIGYPSLMMVDECTTGLDPGARHLVWRVLRPSASDGVSLPAILLSTHYMDEAETLGDRIAMFIDGEIMSTGSLAELKEEYCNSYFIEISLVPKAPQGAQDAVIDMFEREGMPAFVYETLPRRFKLQVAFNGSSQLEQLARIFELLQQNRESLSIQFFAVSQMSLEQIFINLSRGQFNVGTSSRRLNMADNSMEEIKEPDVEEGLPVVREQPLLVEKKTEFQEQQTDQENQTSDLKKGTTVPDPADASVTSDGFSI